MSKALLVAGLSLLLAAAGLAYPAVRLGLGILAGVVALWAGAEVRREE